MSIHVCIDEETGNNQAHTGSLRGWMLADFPVRSVVAELESGKLFPVAFGHNRPDVAKAFPDFINGEACGLFVSFSDCSLDENIVFWVVDEDKAWRRLEVDSGNRQPQTFSSDPAIQPNEVPAQVSEFSHRNDPALIEENVGNWLERAPRLRLRIDLINRCNLRCVMCHYNNPAYTGKPRKIVSLEDFIEFFEPVGKYVHEALLSCADEPLLAPAFIDVLYYLSKNFPHVTISFCTNATLFDAKVQKAVIETGVSKVMVSLDGVLPETYENIRKGAKFDKVLKNLVNFSLVKATAQVDWPELQLNFVMMKSNIAEGPGFVEVAGCLGAGSMDFHHAVPTCGIDMGEEKLEFHPDLFNHYRKIILETADRFNISAFMPDELPSEGLEITEELPVDLSYFEKFLENHELDMPALKAMQKPAGAHSYGISEIYPELFCDQPFSELYVIDQELVRPCPYQQRVAVPLSDYPDLTSIYFGKEFAELRKAMFTKEGDSGCQNCPLKKGQLTVVPTEDFVTS